MPPWGEPLQGHTPVPKGCISVADGYRFPCPARSVSSVLLERSIPICMVSLTTGIGSSFSVIHGSDTAADLRARTFNIHSRTLLTGWSRYFSMMLLSTAMFIRNYSASCVSECRSMSSAYVGATQDLSDVATASCFE